MVEFKTGLTYEDLRICHSLVREANDIRERIERLRSLIEWQGQQMRPTGGGKRTGQVNDPVGRGASELADMEEEGKKRSAAYMQHAKCVDAAISAEVSDSTQRTILRMRYLDGLSWEDISEKTHYSLEWCYKQHKKGLIALGVKKEYS